MIRFIHAADLHLDSAFGAMPARQAAQRRRELREIPGRLSDYVNEKGIGLVLLAVVMTVDGNIINPKLLSDNVEVHPVLVVAALLGGGQVGGMLGMLIAVPAAAFLKLQFEKYLKRREEKQKQEDLPQ